MLKKLQQPNKIKRARLTTISVLSVKAIYPYSYPPAHIGAGRGRAKKKII